MPQPRRASQTPSAPQRSGGSAGATTGRHRARSSTSRPVLLSMLAVLTLLFGSGTAISLTAASPAPAPAEDPGYAALGAAPAPASTRAPASPAASPPAPSPNTETPQPAPEPPSGGEPGGNSGGSSSGGGNSGGGSGDSSGGEATDELTSLENEATRLTNAERVANGCGEVGTDERLRTAARGHSQDMAVNDYFSHDGLDGSSPFDRMRAAGYPNPAGENIAYGYRTPADVVRGWMNSDGHRRNILTCSHQAIGVGLAYGGNGRPYWTQVFGR